MNAEQFKELVNSLEIGKKLPDSIYFHKEAFSEVPETLSKFIKVVGKVTWRGITFCRNRCHPVTPTHASFDLPTE
jgi:hypothetical protein